MEPDINHQIRSAYLWTIAASAVRQSLGFVLSLILARLLHPQDYGLLGMVMVIVQIILLVQDMGLGRGIVYFRDEPPTYPSYFTVSVALGALMALSLAAAAPAIAAFYGIPALIPIVRACSLALLLSSFRIVPNAVLNKRLDFRTGAILDTLTSFIGLLIAILLAYRGWGVWSLVANLLVSNVLQTAVLWVIVPARFTLRPQMDVVRRSVRYGLPLTGSNLLWQLYDNSDFLIVGKVLGAEALGVYTIAFRLATLVNSRIGSIVSSVSFPAFAAMKDSLEQVRRHWMMATSRLAILSFPLLAVLAMNAEDLMRYVYGPKWLAAAGPLRLLCVVGLIRTVTPLTLGMVSSLGRPDVNFKYTLWNTLLIPPGVFAGCHAAGLIGVGWAWVLLFPIAAVYCVRQGLRLTGVSAGEFLGSLAPASKTAALAVLCMLPVHLLVPPSVWRLTGSLAVGGICVLAFALRQPEIRSMAGLGSRNRNVNAAPAK